MELELHKIYKLQFPVPGNTVVAELVEIDTYPASGLPADYIFKYVSGHRGLPDSSDEGKLKFRQNWWRKAHESATKEEIAKFGPMPTEISVEERMTFAFPVGLLPRLKITEVTRDYRITSEDNKAEEPKPEEDLQQRPERSYDPKPDRSYHSLGILGAELEKSTVTLIQYRSGYMVTLTDEIRVFHKGTNAEGLSVLTPECPMTFWSEIEDRKSFSWEYIYYEKDAKIVEAAFNKIKKLPIEFKKYGVESRYLLQYPEELRNAVGNQRDNQLKEILNTNKRLREIKELISNIGMFLHVQHNLPTPAISQVFLPKSKAPETVDLNTMTKEELVKIINSGIRPVLKKVPTYDDKKLGLTPVMGRLFMHFEKKENKDEGFKYESYPRELIKRCICFKQFSEEEVIQIASTESYEKLCSLVDLSSQVEPMLKVIKKELKKTKAAYIGRIFEDIYLNGDRRYSYECA